ncbi:LacI family DNA-binding transcriptional regulator [Halostreptopolyspora alba]|uniref:LacI family transcriptional regulator n=1 Tax=Halostreptopolyspora alba TaxID=2487137 RepID=A0A3N0EG08_9ACTN|nr:LacI family transcriptional regulator [Nocardiopsaceae bacterium YIM 96095]
MSNGRPPTSHDVARLAGVSRSTVSLVFRGAASGRIGERTQRAVVDAARQLGFRPNADARRLRTGGPPMVLIPVPDIVNPFFARVFTGARTAARESGFQVVLSVQRDLDSVAADVAGQRIDAVLACSLRDGGRPLEDPVPVVVLDAEPPPGQGSVRVDIAPALTGLVEHLHRLGHRSIAHLRSEVRTATFRERAEAVDAACARRGMTRTYTSCALDIHAAREAVAALLPAPTGPSGCGFPRGCSSGTPPLLRALRRRALTPAADVRSVPGPPPTRSDSSAAVTWGLRSRARYDRGTRAPSVGGTGGNRGSTT